MIDTVSIEERNPSLEAMHSISLAEEKFCKIGAVLSGNASNQSSLNVIESSSIQLWTDERK
jgi:hypothetical protein